MNLNKRRPVLGVLVGNRGFFPDSLVEEGKRRLLKVLETAGVQVVTLSSEDTKLGAVETLEDAEKCARLFQTHKEELDGVIVTLPNFGDERSAATALRLAELDVPILIHAFPDDLSQLDSGHRRDAFCGKISLCNNLIQYSIPFTDTSLHVEDPESPRFREDLKNFIAVCRVVRGLKGLRLGAVGARPAAFNTVRFSEKLLESYGISVETLDLSELIAQAQSLSSEAKEVAEELANFKESFQPKHIPEEALVKMAKLSIALKRWVEENKIQALAMQCWTALEVLYGIVPCAVMSLLSESGIPSACETDVMGALSMYVLQLASGTPSALLDWNNNYGDDPNKLIFFHCSNLPCSFFNHCEMSYQHIIAGTVGKERTYGTIVGKISPGPATFLRLSTFDSQGAVTGVIAEGAFTADKVETFGGYGVAEIPNLRGILRTLVEKGFEHHVAATKAHVKQAVQEALRKYVGWEILCP